MDRYLRNLGGAIIISLLCSVAIYLMLSFTIWLYLDAFNNSPSFMKSRIVMIAACAIAFTLITAAMRIMPRHLLSENSIIRGSDLMPTPAEGETLRAYTLRRSIYAYELAVMFFLISILGMLQIVDGFDKTGYDLIAMFSFALPIISVMTFVIATTELAGHVRLRLRKNRKVYSRIYDEEYDLYFYDFVDKTN